jgi:excisionase family DNA binding protein
VAGDIRMTRPVPIRPAPLLTAAEVAVRLNVSQDWVWKHASGQHQPRLPSVKLGRLIRFRPEDIAALLEEVPCTSRR